MRQGAQTGMPPGVHEHSAVSLRKTAFYRHSIIGRDACPAADSHIFRSQALANGSKRAVSFSGQSVVRLRHASDEAAYCRLTPLPVENFHMFSSFYTFFHLFTPVNTCKKRFVMKTWSENASNPLRSRAPVRRDHLPHHPDHPVRT